MLLYRSCITIFTNVLGMKRKAAKIVPTLLNLEQKQRPMDIAQQMLTTFNDDWLKKAMTGDELWVYGYDIDTKAIINHTNGSIQKSQY